MLGSVLTTVGMVVKCFINSGFEICIFGQVLAAIGQPFILNAPAKLAAVWFGENERIIALTICTASQAFGAAIGFVVPTIFVSPGDKDLQF